PLLVIRERPTEHRRDLKQRDHRRGHPRRGDAFGGVAAIARPDVGIADSVEADVAQASRETLVGEVDSRWLLYAPDLSRLQADADQPIRVPVGQGLEKHA